MENCNRTPARECGCSNTPSRSMPERSMSNRPMPNRSMPNRSMPNRSMPDCSMSNRSMPNRSMPECSMSNRSMSERSSSPSCHQKNDPLANMPLAMAYVPWQFFQDVYEPDKALQYGTIFPELNKPFYGRGGCPR